MIVYGFCRVGGFRFKTFFGLSASHSIFIFLLPFPSVERRVSPFLSLSFGLSSCKF